MLSLFLLFGTACAYLQENIDIPTDINMVAISDNCTVYSGTNGTVLVHHDTTQVNKAQTFSSDRLHSRTSISSDIIVVNNKCDLVIFGFPSDNRVALWRPLTDTITYIVPEDITAEPLSGPSNEVYKQHYNTSGLENVTRIPISHSVARFGFSLDVQGQSWVVGAPGKATDNNGNNGSPGYAFVFEGDELHSCRSMYEMSCYPEQTGCVSGIEEFVKYYGKLNSPWASTFIPAYSSVPWKSETNRLDITEVSLVQKLCLPLEVPYYKEKGQLDQKVFDDHREVYQQFGYAVALSGELHVPGSALYISAPGDTSHFMEDNTGANYGRVYMWDNVIWPLEATDYVTWWQPNVFTPLELPLEIATYQAFGRDIAVSRNTLAISTYPLYEDTLNPFVILYSCNPEHNTQANCEHVGGIAIDDIRGNPLEYLSVAETTYMDGKISYVEAPDFQNNYIGKNIGVVGSNVIIADMENEKVYRFSNRGEWREQHASTDNTVFATNSEHWVAQTAHKQLTHYWPCGPGHTGPQHQCIPAPHAYYSNDGWELYSYPCQRNFTTTEPGRMVCDPWSAPILYGPTWSDTMSIMTYVLVATFLCCTLLGLWQYTCLPTRLAPTRRGYGPLDFS